MSTRENRRSGTAELIGRPLALLVAVAIAVWGCSTKEPAQLRRDGGEGSAFAELEAAGLKVMSTLGSRGAKLRDPTTGWIGRLKSSVDDGAERDSRCHPFLTEQMAAPEAVQRQSVLIRYRVPSEEAPSLGSLAGLPWQVVSATVLEAQAAIAKLARAMHEEATGRGAPVNVSGPFVVDELGSEEIGELCHHPDVLFVGPYPEPEVADADSVAQKIVDVLPATRTDEVQAECVDPDQGPCLEYVDGTGVRVAVIERGALEPNRSCFNLVNSICPFWDQTDFGPETTVSGLDQTCAQIDAPLQQAYPVNPQDPELCQQAVSLHMTRVVALVGSCWDDDECDPLDPTPWRGYAPGAEILHANAATNIQTDSGTRSVTDWVSALEWAVCRRVNIVSMSFHSLSEQKYPVLSSRDVFFDYWSSVYPMVVLTAAGNEGALCPSPLPNADKFCPSDGGGAYASGKAYNVFGVGNVEIDADDTRSNDTMFGESAWRNPGQGREIPELAAPGSRYQINASWSFGGTSAATPATAGIAALLIQANMDLRSGTGPTAVRAILLATADYQEADADYLEDAPWDWGVQPDGSDPDGRDGAGLVNAWQAYRAATMGGSSTSPSTHGYDHGMLENGVWVRLPPPGAQKLATLSSVETKGSLELLAAKLLDETWEISVPRRRFWIFPWFWRNRRVRVAFTWNSRVDGADVPESITSVPRRGASVLDGDLDLVVLDPNGLPVAWSMTPDNNYELVDFMAPKPGTYTIRVVGFDLNPLPSSAYGIAWMVD